MKKTLLIVLIISSIFAGKTWKLDTVQKLKRIGDVEISPDGKEVIYSIFDIQKRYGEDFFISQIWKGKVDDPNSHFQFTTDNIFSHKGQWSPNGQWIAFISYRSGIAQLYMISPKGGEAVQITNTKDGVGRFLWSPDSSIIAFVSSKEIEKKKKDDDSHLSDLVDVEPTDRYSHHLYIVKGAPFLQQAEEVTPESIYVMSDFDFSPDSKKIVLNYASFDLPFGHWRNSKLAILDIKEKKYVPITQTAGTQYDPKFSPNGRYIAFVRSDSNTEYSKKDPIGILDLHRNKIGTFSLNSDDCKDIDQPGILGWTPDSEKIILTEQMGLQDTLAYVTLSSGRVNFMEGNFHLNNASLSKNSKWIGVSLENKHTPEEAFLITSDGQTIKQLSKQNKELLEYDMPRCATVDWNSYDGQKIEGILVFPKNYEEGKKYPLLLNVHGGPMCKFENTYLGNYVIYPTPSLSEAGFFILKPNPRGSSGYGRKFRQSIEGDWGGKDFQDLMAGVDGLIQAGLVDEDRMGVMGWSYGGYMTAWIITQTNRFAAASMGAGIANLLSHSTTTDGREYMTFHFKGEVWENQKLYLERSPISYIDRINTPLLIQHGYQDERVPYSQSLEMYNALRVSGKPVVLASYPQSAHTVLKPELMKDCIQRNYDWFVDRVKNKR